MDGLFFIYHQMNLNCPVIVRNELGVVHYETSAIVFSDPVEGYYFLFSPSPHPSPMKRRGRFRNSQQSRISSAILLYFKTVEILPNPFLVIPAPEPESSKLVPRSPMPLEDKFREDDVWIPHLGAG